MEGWDEHSERPSLIAMPAMSHHQMQSRPPPLASPPALWPPSCPAGDCDTPSRSAAQVRSRPARPPLLLKTHVDLLTGSEIVKLASFRCWKHIVALSLSASTARSGWCRNAILRYLRGARRRRGEGAHNSFKYRPVILASSSWTARAAVTSANITRCNECAGGGGGGGERWTQSQGLSAISWVLNSPSLSKSDPVRTRTAGRGPTLS